MPPPIAQQVAAAGSNSLDGIREERNWRRLFSSRWHHQVEALEFVSSYIASPANHDRSALVQAPTATGKTGIMAVVANYFAGADTTLVVAPSRALVVQLTDRFQSGFWTTVAAKPPGGPRPVAAFTPTQLTQALATQTSRGLTLVCTPHTLAELWSDADDRAYLALKSLVQLVLVDEGHREPARTWAKAVRDLEKPSVLLSATPYRNDLRRFRVGPIDTHRHRLSFSEASNRNIVRQVGLHAARHSYAGKPHVFVDELVRFYDEDFVQRAPPESRAPRVIVRCESFDSIKKVKRALDRVRPGRSVAVHEQFSGSADPTEREDVPDSLASVDATFWIHQHKLTEGIDDSQFAVLAVYECYGNARSMVQQVGRIIRNPSGQTARSAAVFHDPGDNTQRFWNGYLSYEQQSSPGLGAEDILDAFRKALPSVYYSGYDYRAPTDLLNRGQVLSALTLRRAVQIYSAPADIDVALVERLMKSVRDAAADTDLAEASSFAPAADSHGAAILLHWRVKPSSALLNGGAFDFSLLPTVIFPDGKLLFYQGPVSLGDLAGQESLELLAPTELERLCSGSSSVFTQLSVINCDLGSSVIRRRAIGGAALQNTAPSLSDHFHFLSNCVVRPSGHGAAHRRYLGLTRGHVTDLAAEPVPLGEFCGWARELSRDLAGPRRSGSAVFSRFAQHTPAPPNAQAAHLLLELEEFFRQYRPSDSDGAFAPPPFDDAFVSSACTVDTKSGNFQCDIGATTIHGTVRYDVRRRRFAIDSKELDDFYEAQRSGTRVKPGSYLAKHSARIVTADGHLYAEGGFYRPRSFPWGDNALRNMGDVVGCPEMRNIRNSEKGLHDVDGDTWERSSLFRVLDSPSVYATCQFAPDLLVCVDMGTEDADFIAANTVNRQVALIHAKVWDAVGLAASPFQVVSGQLTKNLSFFSPGSDRWKKVAAKIATPWTVTMTRSKKKVALPRVRSRFGTWAPKDAAQVLGELLHDTRTDRQVWLALGNGFSRQELHDTLEGASNKNLPRYEVIQLTYLMQACNATVGAMGAKLRVLTSP